MTRQNVVRLFKVISYLGIYGGLLMPLAFFPVVIFPFVFSKLIAFQILIGLTFPAYLALMWMEPKYRPPKSALYTAIFAYFGAVLLSVIFSVDPSRSWWGNQERMNGLYTLLHFLAWLTMTIGVLKTWDQWKKLLGYEVVLSVIMGAIALLQKPYPNLLLFPAGDRVGGLLDNPIYMGAYQIFNLAFIMLLIFKIRSMRVRALLVLAAMVDIGAFFAAQSRGALLGLAAMIGVFAVTYAIFTTNKKMKYGVLGSAGVLFASYGVIFLLRTTSFVENSVLNRLTNLSIATETRFIAWDIAWKGFLERPLTGWGFDAFHILFNLKYNPRSLEYGYYETWFDRAHNTVMDVLSMTGIFGFITFFGIFIVLFYLVWRAYKKGWIDLPIMAILTALPVGYFLQNLFVFDHPAAFSMSYLLYAFVIVATRPGFLKPLEGNPAAQAVAAPVGSQPSAAPRAAPWTLFIIIQMIGIFFAWRFSVLPFRASMLAIKANNLLTSGQADTALTLFKQAGQIPTPYTDEQSFLLARDMVQIAQSGQLTSMPGWKEFYALAKEKNELTNSEHPRNTNNLYVYAQLLMTVAPQLPKEEQSAELTKSVEYFNKALETSPARQQIAWGLAQLYSQLGRGQEAYDVLLTTSKGDEHIGESWWYLGGVTWFQLGKAEEGAGYMIKAVKAKSAFALRNVRDAAQLAEAAVVVKDMDTLKSILPLLSDDPSPTGTRKGLGGGSVDLYLSIAQSFEKAGLTGERNSILNALTQVDPTIAGKLLPLQQGKVNTIAEAMKITAEQAIAATSTPASASSTTTLIATSTPVAQPSSAAPSAPVVSSPSSKYSGPRR